MQKITVSILEMDNCPDGLTDELALFVILQTTVDRRNITLLAQCYFFTSKCICTLLYVRFGVRCIRWTHNFTLTGWKKRGSRSSDWTCHYRQVVCPLPSVLLFSKLSDYFLGDTLIQKIFF